MGGAISLLSNEIIGIRLTVMETDNVISYVFPLYID